MSPRHPFAPGRIAIVVAAALVALAGLAGSVAAHPTGHRQTYLQVNLCGNACNDGRPAVVTALERSIAAATPFAVTVEEVCEAQYERLRTDLTDYRTWFDPTGALCHNGNRYGNVLLVHDRAAELVGRWLLPAPAGDEPRHLMCARSQLPGGPSLDLCVTHISTEAGNIGPQVARVAAIVTSLDSDAVMLGGDFNTDPPDVRLDPLYDRCYSGGTGAFVEADTTGCARRDQRNTPVGSDVLDQDTFPRHKYDDIFLRGTAWSSTRASVADAVGGLSDHRALWAITTFGR